MLDEIVPVSLRALPGIIAVRMPASAMMKIPRFKAMIYDNRVERFPNFIEFRLLALLFALALIWATVQVKTYSFLQITIHQEFVLFCTTSRLLSLAETLSRPGLTDAV